MYYLFIKYKWYKWNLIIWILKIWIIKSVYKVIELNIIVYS